MNLFEINSEILSCVNTDTGEIIDSEKLDSLQMERKEKIRNISLWIKNLESDAEQLKAQAAAFTERKKAVEKKAENLREYLKRALNGEKISTPEFEISWRESQAGNVVNMNLIPARFFKIEAPKLDRALLLKMLKEGQEIPGAVLETRQNMILK